MKMGKAIFLLIILTAGIGAFYLKGYMDRSVVELKNGAVITADKTWESDGLIYYKIENEVDLFKKVEVERFGKPELETLLRHAKFELAPFFAKTNTEFKSFAKDTSDSISQNIVWVIGIISVTTFCIIVLLVVHLIMRLRLTQDDAAQHREPAGLKATSSGSSGEAKEGITRLDIVNYFRMLFKLQIGADPQAPMSVISLPATSSGRSPISIRSSSWGLYSRLQLVQIFLTRRWATMPSSDAVIRNVSRPRSISLAIVLGASFV